MADEEHDEIQRIRDWLESVSQDVALAFATRAALRVTPYLVDAPLTDRASLLLSAFRSTLTSSVAAISPSKRVAVAANAAADASAFFSTDELSPATSIAFRATSSTAWASAYATAPHYPVPYGGTSNSAVESNLTKFKDFAVSAFLARPPHIATFSLNWDQYWQTPSERPIEALHTPLWVSKMVSVETEEHPVSLVQKTITQPKAIAEKWSELRHWMLDIDQGWIFWIDWYERHLEGRPQFWELLEQVTWFSSSDWKKSPTVLDKSISKLQSDFEADARASVRRAISEFRATLNSLYEGHSISLPSILETEFQITKTEYESLKEAVEKLTNEAEKNDLADAGVVKKSLGVISKILLGIGALVGGTIVTLATTDAYNHAKMNYWSNTLGQCYLETEKWLQTIPSDP